MKKVYLIAAKRTPIGGFMGNLSDYPATSLGAIAIQGAIKKAGIHPDHIDSVYMGNGLSAGLGQSPARQAAINANIPTSKDATTINKVCASGLKAITLAAQQIQLGQEQVVVAGGMESMSNTPFYANIRAGQKFGNTNLTDGLLLDGLTDAFHHFHMGNAAEITVKQFNISRKSQDDYAISTYKKAVLATKKGQFKHEIIPIKVKQKKKSILINEDEDIYKLIPEKIGQLKPSFEANGTITAANASNLNDGAAAVILASEEAVKTYQLTPLAEIITYADAAQAPELFSTSPALAIRKMMKSTNINIEQIDYFEINEAYASVVLANAELLNIPIKKINVYGGAVAMGHPIGASGTRIVCTLNSVLQQEKGTYGIATICNGGGGSTAILLKRI